MLLDHWVAKNEREGRIIFLQNVLELHYKANINTHLKINLCTKFQLNWTKLSTRTKSGRILGLSETKLELDVILLSQLAISSSILILLVDFTHF